MRNHSNTRQEPIICLLSNANHDHDDDDSIVDKIESFLVGRLFRWSSEDETQQKEDPTKELGRWGVLEEAPDWNDILAAQESLTTYLHLWARQLEQDPKSSCLTTPISTTPFREPRQDEYTFEDESDDDETISSHENNKIPRYTYASMKLMFRPPKRYLSYKEQKGLEKGVVPDRKGAKVDGWSPGGVEILVGILYRSSSGYSNTYTLQLVARRCNVDGDTIIKGTSERAIVRRLEEAIRIWKKARAMPMY